MNGNRVFKTISALFLVLTALSAQAALSVTDDLGHVVSLQKPARRIITLAPHVTELVFAAGAGEQIVATVKYSDYPEAAKAIPRIGDLRQIDLERIIAMKPDLLVVWMHGAFDRQLDALKQSGIPFFFSEPQKLEQIPETLNKFGKLFGTEKQAALAAEDFQRQWQQLRSSYATSVQHAAPVNTFYQVWGKPLYTLNDKHIVNDAIRQCGGVNIFGKLATAAPVVNVEAVLKENPELIISADNKTQEGRGLEQWKAFPTLLATKNKNLISIDGDVLNRAGPRILDGARAICEALEQARSHRPSPDAASSKQHEK